MSSLLAGLPLLVESSSESNSSDSEREQPFFNVHEDVQDLIPIKKSKLKILQKNSGSRCWWCHHSFSGISVGCPTFFSRRTFVMHCEGVFCSFECACAYGVGLERSSNTRFTSTYLAFLRKETLGIPLHAPLKPALHFSTLKAYGGELTIEQYRRHSETICKLKTTPERLRIIPFGYSLFENRRTRRVKNMSVSKKKNDQPPKKKRSIRTLLASVKIRTRKKKKKATNSRSKIIL